MILTPVGTAMAIVATENTATEIGPRPAANMWCAHTPKPTKPIAAPENTTNGYPNSGLRENVGSTSDTMPNEGNTRMYTSGWPKIQNRCCHSSGSAPSATEKKVASKFRWNSSRNSATVMTGMANSSRNCMTSAIHVKIGMRMSVMPGARMLRTVTIRLTAPTCEATPVISRPSVQKSTPLVGENGTELFGAYMNQPPSAAPPRNHDVLMKMPPNTNVQKLERVEARERDVAGADLQRHHVVGERRGHRHHEEEHHRGGVHREHLVVLVGRQDRAVGLGELGPDQQRLEAADEEEHHGGDAVHDADLLVVDGEGPRLPAGGLHRAAEVAVRRRRGDDGGTGTGERRACRWVVR